jgi:cation transport ATPase
VTGISVPGNRTPRTGSVGCTSLSGAGRALASTRGTRVSPENELLALVAAAEADSEHPVAAAVMAGAHDRGINLPAGTDFDSITGKGVRARVAGHAVLLGTATLLAENGIDTGELEPISVELAAAGKTPVLAAVDDQPAGVSPSPTPSRTTLSRRSPPCASCACRS